MGDPTFEPCGGIRYLNQDGNAVLARNTVHPLHINFYTLISTRKERQAAYLNLQVPECASQQADRERRRGSESRSTRKPAAEHLCSYPRGANCSRIARFWIFPTAFLGNAA